MRILFAICMVPLMLSVSCKKSTEQPDTPPVPTGTNNPPVVKVDTSTLLKSSWTYEYDMNGILTDSSFLQWKYDDQRRIVQHTEESASYRDTFSYSFLKDRYIEVCHAYYNGSLELISNGVYYQHVNNRTDSLLFTSAGYGLNAGLNGYSATYYYYNQAGQVSLEKEFQSSTSQPLYNVITNYFYTGANLDSTVSINTYDKITDVSYYSGGNLTVFKRYTPGVQEEIDTYNYSNIPTGGLCFIYGNSQLISGITGVTIPATSSHTSTWTYQLDPANRVVSGLLSRDGVAVQKQVFTYY
jgi:hypothetical protein